MTKEEEEQQQQEQCEEEKEGSEIAPQNSSGKNHASKVVKNRSKQRPPSSSTATMVASEEIFSSQKSSMDYVTVQGVILRTGYHNKRDWYLLCIKELLDNAETFYGKNIRAPMMQLLMYALKRQATLYFALK
jgi:hypothetical protein